MKTSFICLAVLSCVLAFAVAGRGGRVRGRGRGRNRDNNDEGCSEWVMQDCVPRAGICGRGTQNGTRTGDTCEVKAKTFRCRKPCNMVGDSQNIPRGCKYNKRRAQRGDCEPSTNTQTIVMTLKKGGSECPETKTITRPCRQQREARGAGKGGRGRGKPCKYRKGDWSACDETTNMMTKTLTLKKGDPSTCEQTKTITRKCKKEKCTFGPWSQFGECQNGVRTKTRQVLSGGDDCQSRTSKTKPCRN